MGISKGNFNFRKLKRPPVHGKAGFEKLEAKLVGIIDISQQETGLHLARTTVLFRLDRPDDVNITQIANPNTEIALYLSCLGRHSVVYFREEFWAVMAVIRKHKLTSSTIVNYGKKQRHVQAGELQWVNMSLLKPGASYSRKGESGTWEGLPDRSVKYLTEFMRRFWESHVG